MAYSERQTDPSGSQLTKIAHRVDAVVLVAWRALWALLLDFVCATGLTVFMGVIVWAESSEGGGSA